MHGCPPPLALPRSNVVWLDEVDSTNTYVLGRFNRLPHGLFVAASQQRAGVGRLGRTWHSPRGNVYMTGVARPPLVPPADDLAGLLTQSMAVSVCDVLEDLGISSTVKWPNDVRVGGRKIAGILARAVWCGDQFAGAAVGVGINVNMGPRELAPIDQPATSLSVLTSRTRDPRAVAHAVATRFAQRMEDCNVASLRQEVKARSECLGRTLFVSSPGGSVTGRALDIDEAFRLIVEDEHGVVHAAHTGDVRC